MADVRIERVTKLYGQVPAVNGVDLIVRDREFVVLVGPSGCGKTTLLRCIAGLERLDGGNVHIGDRDVTDLPPRRRRIAMVFQSYAVFPHLKVFDNIAFGLRMQRVDRATVEKTVESFARLLDILPLLDRYPSQISGGQRQRVAVARALAVKADVLLMDEPLSNLDALLRMQMRAELKTLLREVGTTTIYVTHDQAEALSMGDRVAVMRTGQIAQVDSPIAVYDHPANTYVGGFIGTPPMSFLEAEVSPNGAGQQVNLSGGTFRLASSVELTSAHRKLLMGVRAEAITLHSSPQPNAIRGRVVVTETLGSHNLVTVRVGGDLIKVSTPPALAVVPDNDVWLEFAADRLRWMDRDTGDAVPAATAVAP